MKNSTMECNRTIENVGLNISVGSYVGGGDGVLGERKMIALAGCVIMAVNIGPYCQLFNCVNFKEFAPSSWIDFLKRKEQQSSVIQEVG